MEKNKGISELVLALCLVSFIIFSGYKIAEHQDAKYEKYSERAKKLCARDSGKRLVYDKELKYWKCYY